MSRVRPREPLGFIGTGSCFAVLVGACWWVARPPPPAPPAPPALAHARAPDAQPVDAAQQMSMVTLVPGKGPAVRRGDRVQIRFTGHLVGEGTRSFVVGRGEVMKGWEDGVVGMQVGEKRRLVIPPAMQSHDLSETGVPITCQVEMLAIGGGADLE
jgi:FKBP-type peptidyl-prolyl cis-trans isomerase